MKPSASDRKRTPARRDAASSIAVRGLKPNAAIATLAAIALFAQVASSATMNEQKILTPADAAVGDQFGYATAISGDTAVVGAHANDGAVGSAYIFERNLGGAGNWGEAKKLPNPEPAADDQFGVSVDIEGDILVVGAFADDTPVLDAGSAYVFYRNQGGAGNWGQVAKLIASDGGIADLFGVSVAISGSTIIVGAYTQNNATGAAYIFERNQGGADNWGQTVKILAIDGANNDQFGWSVGLDGDNAIIASLGDDDQGGGSGSAYIHGRNQGGAGAWGLVKKILPLGGAASDQFGRSVAIDGGTAIVGAIVGGLGDTGAAYVFEQFSGGANNWGQVKQLTASDALVNDQFGIDVAVDGDVAIVGSFADDDNGSASGSAYVFGRDNGGTNAWGEVHKLLASNGIPNDWFGWSVAVAGSTGLVGAHHDPNETISPGWAYIFDVSLPPVGGTPGYALDGWGGVHNMGGAPDISPSTPYFGFDVAIDIELVVNGYYVLERFGGVHTGGAAPPMSPHGPYFGVALAQALELAPGGGYYMLDVFGGVHAAGGAPVLSFNTPYFGFGGAQDFELSGAGYVVMDTFGALYPSAGAPPINNPTPYFGFDIARDMEFGPVGFYVLDGFGGLHAGDGAPALSPATPFFGWDIARDFELAPIGFYVLDGFGAAHAGGGAPIMGGLPYFAFDAARDMEIQ